MKKKLSKSKGASIIKTRKQIRKETRKQKKIKRNENYLKKGKLKNSHDNCILHENQNRKEKQNIRNEDPLNYCSTLDKQMKETQKEAMKFKKLKKQMKLERIRQLQEANEQENKVIKSLEKKLKLNRRKNQSLPKSFDTDGLNYLLEICDYEKYKDSINLEKELNEAGIEFDDDLAVVTGSKKSSNECNENESYPNNDFSDDNFGDGNDCNTTDENSEFDDANDNINDELDVESSMEFSDEESFQSDDPETVDGPEQNIKKKKKVVFADSLAPKTELIENKSKTCKIKSILKNKNSNEKSTTATRLKNLQDFVAKESNNGNDSASSDTDEETDFLESKKSDTEFKNELREDIYGRLRDEKGNIVENNHGKYIPPQLRTVCDENSEVVQRLRKQMKGALNRLTESNMHSIATQIENLYMKYSRNDTNYVLWKLLKESLISPILSPERIVIEHAVLISVLHANVGNEIGAFILQRLIEELNEMFKESLHVENKQIDNLIMILSHLYNFKVFHASLIYEILKKLTERFQEKDIELILLVLKNVGFSLRKDDPRSLKELILNIQKKANESTALRENTRVRFMLDTLLAVKNNNMLKIPNYDPSYVEHLKKIQHKSLIRYGKYVSELKISMEDLLNAETRGRWWIVGSAWNADLCNKNNENKELNSLTCSSFDQKILELAKKQRMNTDTRRNIFCVLMTAEDCIDAFEKLMKLDLKGQQYQEIIYVLMHCLLKEKQYNPYYTFLAEQFCIANRKYQLAIQFCTWDKLNEIDSFSSQQIINLAKFLTYLFLELKLPLSVLKVLQFTEMNKPMVKLIRQIMLAILLHDNEDVIVDVFSRISKSEKLFMLREGLQLFLHHFVLKNIEKNAISGYEGKMQILPKRVELAVSAMQKSTSDW